MAHQISEFKDQEAQDAYLSILDDWHNDLALTRAIASNMPRELLHVRNQLRLLGLGRSSAHTAAKVDSLACYLTVEGTEQELLRLGRVEKIKSAPIDAGRWG
jgi:hypothetical protein